MHTTSQTQIGTEAPAEETQDKGDDAEEPDDKEDEVAQRLMTVGCHHHELIQANLRWGLMFCKWDRRWGLQEYKTKYMHVEHSVVQ